MQHFKKAGANEGKPAFAIASTIWCDSDAYDHVLRIMERSDNSPLQRDAEMGAVIARVVALACKEVHTMHDHMELSSYKRFFYFLGAIGLGSIGPTHRMLHHAVAHLSQWGGFEVEIDNYVEDKKSSCSIYKALYNEREQLGCAALLKWQAQWKYGIEATRPQHVHKSGKFDDYTNFLLRWDGRCPTVPTSHRKLAEHKGDFAAYMEKHLSSQSDSDIMNPAVAATPIPQPFSPYHP